jgi:hypothetical protein
MFKRTLAKTLDYFFGFGNKKDYYNTAISYLPFSGNEVTQTIEKNSLRIDKFSKIAFRSTITMLEMVEIYYLNSNNSKILLSLAILEAGRAISLLIDYKNKKRILYKKDKTIDDMFNLPEDRTKENLDINNIY